MFKHSRTYYLRQAKNISEQEKNWEIEKDNLTRINNLKKEKQEFKTSSKKISASKILMAFLFLNCTGIELYTGYIINKMFSYGMVPDFSPLLALIGAVVGEVVALAVYFIKSAKENTQGGIVYQSMMNDFEISQMQSNDEDTAAG